MSKKENSRLGSVALLALLAGSAAGFAWADAGPRVTHAVLDDAVDALDGVDVSIDPPFDGTVEDDGQDDAQDDPSGDQASGDDGQDDTGFDGDDAGDDAGDFGDDEDGIGGEDDGDGWTDEDDGDWVAIDDGEYPMDGISDPDVIYYMSGEGTGPIVGGEEVQRSVTKDAPATPEVAHDAEGGDSCALPLDRTAVATCQ